MVDRTIMMNHARNINFLKDRVSKMRGYNRLEGSNIFTFLILGLV